MRINDGSTIHSNLDLEADDVIVGSGAGGAVVAAVPRLGDGAPHPHAVHGCDAHEVRRHLEMELEGQALAPPLSRIAEPQAVDPPLARAGGCPTAAAVQLEAQLTGQNCG